MAVQFSELSGDALYSTAWTSEGDFAACYWFQLHASHTWAGFLTVSDSGNAEYIGLATNSQGIYIDSNVGGSTLLQGSFTLDKWAFAYHALIGSTLYGGVRLWDAGSFSTGSQGNITPASLDRLFLGTYHTEDNRWSANCSLAHVKAWADSDTPTVAQLQAEMWSARPIQPSPWAWYPLLGESSSDYLRDLSPNARTLTSSGTIVVVDPPPIGWGGRPIIVPSSAASYSLAGITKDNDGVALGSCDVFLCKDNGDDTATWLDHTTSHATTGAYSFAGIADTDAAYFVLAFKDGGLMDATDHVLQPS